MLSTQSARSAVAILAAIAVFAPPPAHAEQSLTCGQAGKRPSLYAATGLAAIGGTLDPQLAGTMPSEQVSVRPALDLRAGAAMHVARDRGVRVELSRVRAGLDRHTVSATNQGDLPDTGLGDLFKSQFIVSVTRQSSRKGRNCGYYGAGAGVTRFRYEESSGKGAVVSGFLAYERLLTRRRSVLVEVEVQATGDEGRLPLSEATVFDIKVSAGLRWRF